MILYYYKDKILSRDEEQVREYMAKEQMSKRRIENDIGVIFDHDELVKYCAEYGLEYELEDFKNGN